MKRVTTRQIKEFDRRYLIAKSGGRCARCKVEIFSDNRFGEISRIGDDCHICAFSPSGPRGQGGPRPAEINGISNLILLCKNCHALVDSQPVEFNEEVLRRTRDDHYAWVAKCLGSAPVRNARFHYLIYINVPRVEMYASARSIFIPQIDLGGYSKFSEMGFGAGRAMAAYTHAINSEELYSNILTVETKFSDLKVGSYWFFDSISFRTKRAPPTYASDQLPALWEREESIIYKNFPSWRLVLRINPDYAPTSTALTSFGSGHLTASGVINISNNDAKSSTITASPLFLGAPEHQWP